MTYWKSPIEDEDATADVEREFLMELRELRVLLDKEKEHKMLAMITLTCMIMVRKITLVSFLSD